MWVGEFESTFKKPLSTSLHNNGFDIEKEQKKNIWDSG